MTALTQMERTIQWLNENALAAPAWAKYMICDKHNREYGYFAEQKPVWDKERQDFLRSRGQWQHFRANNPGWGIRYQIHSRHVRIMETGENGHYDELGDEFIRRYEEAEANKPTPVRCPNCEIIWRDEDKFDWEVEEVEWSLETVNIHYNILCNGCFTNRALSMKVRSPLHIIDGDPKVEGAV